MRGVVGSPICRKRSSFRQDRELSRLGSHELIINPRNSRVAGWIWLSYRASAPENKTRFCVCLNHILGVTGHIDQAHLTSSFLLPSSILTISIILQESTSTIKLVVRCRSQQRAPALRPRRCTLRNQRPQRVSCFRTDHQLARWRSSSVQASLQRQGASHASRLESSQSSSVLSPVAAPPRSPAKCVQRFSIASTRLKYRITLSIAAPFSASSLLRVPGTAYWIRTMARRTTFLPSASPTPSTLETNLKHLPLRQH